MPFSLGDIDGLLYSSESLMKVLIECVAVLMTLKPKQLSKEGVMIFFTELDVPVLFAAVYCLAPLAFPECF